MLAVSGAAGREGLCAAPPRAWRGAGALALPAPVAGGNLNRHMDALSADMAATPAYKVYLGAGS